MAFYHKKISSIQALQLEKERLKLELDQKSIKNLITLNDLKSSLHDEFSKKGGAFSIGTPAPLVLNFVSGSGLAEMALGYVFKQIGNRRNKKRVAKMQESDMPHQEPKAGKTEKLIGMLIKGVEGMINLQKGK